MSFRLPCFSARRLSCLPILLCLIACLAGLAPGLLAQTAHFSGAIKTLGSGFSYPNGVAVDGSGNVFVADYGHHAVKEIIDPKSKRLNSSHHINSHSVLCFEKKTKFKRQYANIVQTT